MINLTNPAHKAEYRRLLLIYGEAVANRYAIVVTSPPKSKGGWSKIIPPSKS